MSTFQKNEMPSILWFPGSMTCSTLIFRNLKTPHRKSIPQQTFNACSSMLQIQHFWKTERTKTHNYKKNVQPFNENANKCPTKRANQFPTKRPIQCWKVLRNTSISPRSYENLCFFYTNQEMWSNIDQYVCQLSTNNLLKSVNISLNVCNKKCSSIDQ